MLFRSESNSLTSDISVVPFLLECAVDYLFQLGGISGTISVNFLGVEVRIAAIMVACSLTSKREHAGDHFVHHDAEAPNVRS
jgi:hypothetical protein